MLSALLGYPSGDSASSPLIPPARGTAYRINRSDSDLLPFMPPASWTAHREDRSPCHCSTDRTSLASLAEMDPLIADGYHNLICSPLCRLPEELLLDIMKRLDLVSIQCLRRVSRLFLRLYCSPPFRGCHCDSSLLGSTYDHWCQPKDELRVTWSRRLQVLLDEDISNYCEDCRRRRTDESWTTKSTSLTMDYLHCSGCSNDHPTCLFSKTQRLKSPKTRICIGREGFVRVCEHRVVTWKEVIRTGRQLARLDTKLAKVFLDKCQHESHSPNHHRKDTSQTNYQMTYPVIQICGSVDNPIWVELVWHGHLYLPNTGFDEEGYNEIATPTLIRQQLEQFRQGVAKYIAPEISPGRLIEMSCFDPNRCSCLRYAGLEQLPDGWQLTPRQDPVLLACRMYPRNRLRPLRSSQMTEQGGLHLQSEQNYVEYHRSGVLATGAPLLGSSRIVVRIESCPSKKRCLQIQYTRLITTTANY